MPEEPWVNFSNPDEDLDRAIFLRPDGQERVHIYLRPDGTFGVRDFVWTEDAYYKGWTVGSEWGHRYDSMPRAVREATGLFPWIMSGYFNA